MILVRIKKILLYLLLFFYIYRPPLSKIILFPSNIVMFCLMAVIFLILLNKSLLNYILIKKNVGFLYIQIILVIYILTVQVINNNLNIDGITSNLLFVIDIFNGISLYLLIKKYTECDIGKGINIIINLGLIQAVIIGLMHIYPAFQNIAFQLYEGSQIEWFLSSRIFGLALDYTYMLPIVLSFIATVSLLWFIETGKNIYVLKSIIIIMASVSNGRTGFIIYVVSIFIIILFELIKRGGRLKISFVFIIALTAAIISILYNINTNFALRVDWVLDSVSQVINYIFNEDTGGVSSNIGALTETMVFFPKGIHLLFGYGHRVFGDFGIQFIGRHSDIGYINDLFKGGIIYIIILYSAIFSFLRINKSVNNYKLYNLIIIVSLLIANYKGSAMTGSSLVLVILLFKLIMNNFSFEREETIQTLKHYSAVKKQVDIIYER